MIHPTAVIDPKAQIAADVTIGPFVVIEADVIIGTGCTLGAHASVLNGVRLGKNNKVHAGAVIGDLPQDIRFKGEPTLVEIGDNNTFREHVTVHRSNSLSEPTRVGSGNFLMANSHVGHNTQIGNHVIIANGALLAGHVIVGDRVFISGNCRIHQFVRIGKLAFMQGGSGISKDLPPFTIARGDNGICGLNSVGMRRAGMTSEERLELRRLYHFLFRGDRKLRDAIEEARPLFATGASAEMLDFLSATKRGIAMDGSRKLRGVNLAALTDAGTSPSELA